MVETKLWTAWIHYSATGEGVTYMAIIDYATTPEDIKQKFTERFGEYFTIGCEVGVGVVRNPVTKFLFSEALLTRLENNESEGACGALSANGEYHVNAS